MLIVSLGQLTVATCSWSSTRSPLTAVVWVVLRAVVPPACAACSGMVVAGLHPGARAGRRACCGAVSESVVGAATIRAYGVEERTAARIDAAIEDAPSRRRSAPRSGSPRASPPACWSSGLTTAVVVVVGTWLAVHGQLTLGELLAFLFLVQLFTGPVQTATEVLNEMQNAVAGWRRVLGGHRHPGRRGRPGRGRRRLPRGPITVDFDDVGYAYPGGAPVLQRRRPADRAELHGSPSSARPARARPRSPGCSPG